MIAASNQYGTGYSSLGDDLCGTFTYGECEDYYLNVAANTGCPGTPSPGPTTATVNPLEAGSSSAIGITTTPSGADITYQWEFSTDNSIWQTASGEVAATYNVSPTSDTWYRCLVSCPSGGSAYSDPLQLTLIYCSPSPSSVDGSGITNISFGSVNNATGTEGGNYGDYSAQSEIFHWVRLVICPLLIQQVTLITLVFGWIGMTIMILTMQTNKCIQVPLPLRIQQYMMPHL